MKTVSNMKLKEFNPPSYVSKLNKFTKKHMLQPKSLMKKPLLTGSMMKFSKSQSNLSSMKSSR